MSNYTPTYEPYDSLVSFHNLPHLNDNLKPTSKDFDPSPHYALSILALPLIILVIAAVLYQLPPMFYQIYNLVNVHKRLKTVTPRSAIITLIFVTLLFSQAILHGTLYLGVSVEKTSEGIHALEGRSLEIRTQVSKIRDTVGSVDSALKTDNCTKEANSQVVQSALALVTEIGSNLNKTLKSVQQILDTLANVDGFLLLVGITYTRTTFSCVYGASMLALLVLLAVVK